MALSLFVDVGDLGALESLFELLKFRALSVESADVALRSRPSVAVDDAVDKLLWAVSSLELQMAQTTFAAQTPRPLLPACAPVLLSLLLRQVL